MLGWGRYPVWAGVLIVLGAAFIGTAITAAFGAGPVRAVGVGVAVGTVAASTSVRAPAAYTIIPVPALAYAAAAFTAGYIHDHAVDTSRTVLTLNSVQWLAGGFLPMTAATALAIVIAVARWLLRTLARRSAPQAPGPRAAGEARHATGDGVSTGRL
jgi:hypothetical protein